MKKNNKTFDLILLAGFFGFNLFKSMSKVEGVGSIIKSKSNKSSTDIISNYFKKKYGYVHVSCNNSCDREYFETDGLIYFRYIDNSNSLRLKELELSEDKKKKADLVFQINDKYHYLFEM